MTGSDEFGDSDDEALIFAATQVDAIQTHDTFEESPRPAKRRRVGHGIDDTDDDGSQSSQTLAGFDVTQADPNIPEEEQEERLPQIPRYQFHNPKVQANLNHIIITQTQLAAPSQPWMIRGPIWRKPDPVERPQKSCLEPKAPIRGSEDVMHRDSVSDDDDEIEEIMEDDAASNLNGYGMRGAQMYVYPIVDIAILDCVLMPIDL
jgi:ATP-dependent DNA helicase MPH1